MLRADTAEGSRHTCLPNTKKQQSAVDVTTGNGGNDGQRQNTSTPMPSPQPGPLRLRDQDNNTSYLRLSPVSSTDMTQDTYSDVLQKPEEWQQINRRKNIKSKTKGHDNVLNLKKIKYEKSVTLYVRNIFGGYIFFC